jgi:hypothetical protein
MASLAVTSIPTAQLMTASTWPEKSPTAGLKCSHGVMSGPLTSVAEYVIAVACGSLKAPVGSSNDIADPGVQVWSAVWLATVIGTDASAAMKVSEVDIPPWSAACTSSSSAPASNLPTQIRISCR